MGERAKAYPTELIDAAESLTKLVAADKPFDETMSRLVELAVQAIDGADECSLSLATRGGKRLKTVATTSEVGETIDYLQRHTGEGPCMSSIEETATFHIADMEQDETWPTFSKQAADRTGIQSMLSFVLRLSDEETGAMNMLATSKGGFSDDDLDTGALFAAQAAVAMSDAIGHAHDQEKMGQLEGAMKTRQMIGQAVGIVMATRQVSGDEAFEILKRVSQNANVKLRDIAEEVVEKAEDL